MLASQELLNKDLDSFISIFGGSVSRFLLGKVLKHKTISKLDFISITLFSLSLENSIDVDVFASHGRDLGSMTHFNILVVQLGGFYFLRREFRTLGSGGEEILTVM